MSHGPGGPALISEQRPASMTQSAPVRKAALRSLALARRAGIDSATALHFAESLPSLARDILGEDENLAIALYAPFRGEPDCGRLLAALRAAGHRTLLPSVPSRAISSLVFRAHEPGDPLVPGPLGAIPEPPSSRPAETPDLLFAPCAAFDRRGGRIGFGRGYYDATLARLRAQGSLRAVGIAFAAQEVEEVPLEPHDELLDYVITETQVHACAENRKALNAAALHR